MKVTQMPPVHAANLVANSGNAAFRVNVIGMLYSACVLSSGIYAQLPLCEKLSNHRWTGIIQKLSWCWKSNLSSSEYATLIE